MKAVSRPIFQKPLPGSEYVLNAENNVYHLNLSASKIANNVIVVGDPGRVEAVASFFDSVDFETHHREFYTKTGKYKGKRITVLSTGIGTDNIDIVVNELDAAVNIDPKTRKIKDTLRKLNIVRIGTSGSLQSNIEVDSYVASEYAVGFDGVLHFYKTEFSEEEEALSEAFVRQTKWNKNLAKPYVVKGSSKLLKAIAHDMDKGITATANGFYGPQGRTMRLPLQDKKLNEKLRDFSHDHLKLTNFEMETSALYGLGAMLGHECLTVCLIIANRFNQTFSSDYKSKMNSLIQTVLDRI